MFKLLAGLAVFHGVHLLPTRVTWRDALTARLGRGGYLAMFSLVSLIGLALIVVGYGDARLLGRANPQLWSPPSWTRHVVFLLMLVSMILLVAAYVPSRIRDGARHPMLAAVKIWAFAHLLVRGDLASMLLFGSFLAYAVVDRWSAMARQARGPLGNAPGTIKGDIIVVVGGLVLYALMLLYGHQALIGIPLLRLPVVH